MYDVSNENENNLNSNNKSDKNQEIVFGILEVTFGMIFMCIYGFLKYDFFFDTFDILRTIVICVALLEWYLGIISLRKVSKYCKNGIVSGGILLFVVLILLFLPIGKKGTLPFLFKTINLILSIYYIISTIFIFDDVISICECKVKYKKIIATLNGVFILTNIAYFTLIYIYNFINWYRFLLILEMIVTLFLAITFICIAKKSKKAKE